MPRYEEWHSPIEGISRKIFPPGKDMMSMMITFKTGSIGPAHSHPHEQLTFVISGRLSMTMNGEIIVAGAGEQIVVPGDAVHEVTALEDSVVIEIFTPLRADLLATITE
ncbi:cupin domain-containing protein [Paenibacillus sp. OV219]|uniref:cupin domain-containing protein n=1 Tax=Paenibacillus sp. OV219 TaxID=1884377 RepID=UPI0008B3492F|nr:cupin domain-containing protein [Paenibacillus sp. OV219]SEO75817.1 Cupin domain protein [Paenibacillus sp. OV219]